MFTTLIDPGFLQLNPPPLNSPPPRHTPRILEFLALSRGRNSSASSHIVKAKSKIQGWGFLQDLCKSVFQVRIFLHRSVQSNFDKRGNLKREKVYCRKNFCAFLLVSQAECATFRRIILEAGALRVDFPARLSKLDCILFI
jgi:hypothetical protein